ncbi:MAG: RNA polymerase sigma-70 factor [Bacteroidales bacterium]|nr:RNA polymerase sigma-70 factor [Bacteroidales bacterium]
MSDLMASYEKILIGKLINSDQTAFTIIFKRYYEDLVRFSFGITRHQDSSEEIVQDVFLKLWENRSKLEIHYSLKSYLLKSVQNKSIDNLRHASITNAYASIMLEHPVLFENDTENYVFFSELANNFQQAMEKIPAQYAEVFRMSRLESLNYQEIATKLGISVRTVEVRISKAISLLRNELKDFLIALFIILQLFHY